MVRGWVMVTMCPLRSDCWASFAVSGSTPYTSQSLPWACTPSVLPASSRRKTLFMRGDEVEAAWAWTDPIIAGFEARLEVVEQGQALADVGQPQRGG